MRHRARARSLSFRWATRVVSLATALRETAAIEVDDLRRVQLEVDPDPVIGVECRRRSVLRHRDPVPTELTFVAWPNNAPSSYVQRRDAGYSVSPLRQPSRAGAAAYCSSVTSSPQLAAG